MMTLPVWLGSCSPVPLITPALPIRNGTLGTLSTINQLVGGVVTLPPLGTKLKKFTLCRFLD